MNDIEYVFEGHDLTTEVVMVQVRDNPDEPWSVPKRLGMICTKSQYPFFTINSAGMPQRYKYARLANTNIKPWTLKIAPWTLETAPRHLEVELEKGFFYVAFIKTEELVTFLKDGERCQLTWKALAQYKQWDGTPCGEVSE